MVFSLIYLALANGFSIDIDVITFEFKLKTLLKMNKTLKSCTRQVIYNVFWKNAKPKDSQLSMN